MTAATSASDRYDEARKVIAWFDKIDSTGLGLSGAEDAARAALRGLVEVPEVSETPEKAAMRVYMGIHSFPWLVDGDAMRDLIQRGYLAGIQAAWESWEPENAPGMVDTRSTYTLASLDGTDDEASWLTAGHVLTAQEAEWLRRLEVVR